VLEVLLEEASWLGLFWRNRSRLRLKDEDLSDPDATTLSDKVAHVAITRSRVEHEAASVFLIWYTRSLVDQLTNDLKTWLARWQKSNWISVSLDDEGKLRRFTVVRQ